MDIVGAWYEVALYLDDIGLWCYAWSVPLTLLFTWRAST